MSAINSVSTANFCLPYHTYGDGPELLLCFHGYSRNGTDFSIFRTELGKRYTIIAFDFFYHGVNQPEKVPGVFTPSDLCIIVEKILWEYKKVKCSLMGFSMGGRLVLGLIHKLPHRIHEIFLLAPDGLKSSPLQQIFTMHTIGKTAAEYFLNKPEHGTRLIKLAHRMKIITDRQQQFMLSHIESFDDRQKVLNIWRILKGYDPKVNLIRHYLKTRPIRTEVFFGINDRIIPATLGKRFFGNLPENKCSTHLLDCGHSLLMMHYQISRIINAVPVN